MSDKFRDECGVFGIHGHKEAAHLSYLGLYALQHRGQESAGIVTSTGREFYVHKKKGHVNDVFKEDDIAGLKGTMAIGHVRYSTAGASVAKNAQPIVVECHRGSLAIAHNGNLVNAAELRQELEEEGSIFQTDSDTEVILHMVSRSRRKELHDALVDAFQDIRGAYSLLVMTKRSLIAVRDIYGVRPLCLGRLDGSYVVASETCAFDLIGAEYIREIEPGEMVTIDSNGVRTDFPYVPETPRPCIFEYVYFARPDSNIYGKNVHLVRQAFGRQLAKEHAVEADLVIPVPDSGIAAAMGYAKESGIPLEMGIIRNHYVGRTFIEPGDSIRNFSIKVKLNPIRDLIEGQRVVVVDDSVVRGNTSRKLIQILRNCGAKEIHFRVSSPPTTHPCFYGIDTPTREELIAAQKSVDEIKDFLKVESLGYMSQEGMIAAAQSAKNSTFCTACFDGEYNVGHPQKRVSQLSLSLAKT